MKLQLFATLLIISTNCFSQDKFTQSIETFAQSVFESIKNDNQDEFCSKFPSKADAIWFSQQSGKTLSDSELNTQIDRRSEHCYLSLQSLISIGNASFWSEAKMGEIDISNPDKSLYGVPRIDIGIQFHAYDIIYTIYLDECFLFENGWRLGDEPRIQELEDEDPPRPWEFVCDLDGNQMEMNMCSKRKYDLADSVMNVLVSEIENLYNSALEETETDDEFSQTQYKTILSKLRESQELFVEYRLSTGYLESSKWGYGSIRPLMVNMVMLDLTVERIDFLEGMLDQ